jgi:hypothetical protein
VAGANNITVVPLYARPGCPVYCYDLSSFHLHLLNSTNSCICDSSKLEAVSGRAGALPL